MYHLMKAEGLITFPGFVVINAADAVPNPTLTIDQPWQTDFTYLEVPGGDSFTCRSCSSMRSIARDGACTLHSRLEALHHHERSDVTANSPRRS